MTRVLPLLVAILVTLTLCGSRDASPIRVPPACASERRPRPDDPKELEAKIKELQEQQRKAKAKEIEEEHLQEMKKLQGKWKVTRSMAGGQVQKELGHWTFDADKLTPSIWPIGQGLRIKVQANYSEPLDSVKPPALPFSGNVPPIHGGEA